MNIRCAVKRPTSAYGSLLVRILGVLLGGITLLAGQVAAQQTSRGAAVEVKVVGDVDRGFRLLRGGLPYHVLGAGMESANIESLASHGGNSLRTWTTENPHIATQALLDAAQNNNVTIALCLELGKERHGFDYDDEEAVANQLEHARAEVLKYKDHPALLFWIIGNELNYDFTNPRVFDAVNEISKMIHRLDGQHPTTTALAGFNEELIAIVQERAPDLDFPSFQLYAGIDELPRKLEDSGYRGPFMITEWGVTGHWESEKTTWGAPIEPTSSEKAELYIKRYENVISTNSDKIIGSYAFLWGQKQERTPTWYGMMLEDGSKTEVMDAMHYLWTGTWPEERAPRVKNISLDAKQATDSVVLRPGLDYPARLEAYDPDDGLLHYQWEVMRESASTQKGGDPEIVPDAVPVRITVVGPGDISIKAPVQPGAYRLFVRVYDEKGFAGHANIPFMVEPETQPVGELGG